VSLIASVTDAPISAGRADAQRRAARDFVATRRVPTWPAVPPVAAWLLRLALPGLSVDESTMALARFSAPPRVGVAPAPLADIARSVLRVPAIIAFLLARAVSRRPTRRRFDVLLYCGERTYFEGRLARIAHELRDLSVGISGSDADLDTPPMRLEFDARAAWRVALVAPLALPLLTVTAVRARSNVLKGFGRAAATYTQALAFFHRFPCRAFLTYEENTCSPTMHAAFRAAGGRMFAAFQNGLWYNDEGFDHSSVDVLFSLGQAWADRHRRLGSRVTRAVPVGALLLGSQPAAIAGIAKRYDVVFIDQGTPDAGAQHWSTAGPAQAAVFLEFVRRFARGHPKLRLVYQMRAYPTSRAFIGHCVHEWFAGVPIELLEGHGFMQAYRTVAASNVAVTIHSTLGLEAFAMGTTPVFCNFTGLPDYDVLPGPLQVNAAHYETFAERVEAALAGRIGPQDVDVDYFLSSNTLHAPAIIAGEIRRAVS